MKKKIFALMLSCVMVLAMAACGDEEEGGPEGGGVNINTPGDGGTSVNTPEPGGSEPSGMTAYDANGLRIFIPDEFTPTETEGGSVVFAPADRSATITIGARDEAVDMAPTDFTKRRYQEIWEYAGCDNVEVQEVEVLSWPDGATVSMGVGTGSAAGKSLNLGMQIYFAPMDEKTGEIYYYSIMYAYPESMSDAFTTVMASITLAPAE